MKEVRAREGMYLTQNGDVSERIFVKAIKGMNINEYDWREASESEKQEYESKLNLNDE